MTAQIDTRTGLVLGLDPSSTAIGYGVLTLDGRFVEAGLIEPKPKSAGSWVRDMQMTDDVEMLLARLTPAVVLIEWTKGKVNKNRHRGRGAGLAVYGTGVGSVGRQCWLWARGQRGVTIEAVLENDWTRGVPKDKRQLAVAAGYPQYAPHLAGDKGGDIADAIGMVDWWLRENLFGRL